MAVLNLNGTPHIDAIEPKCALAGGEIRITGHSLRTPELRRPAVHFAGDVSGAIVISSNDFLVARVPDGASSGDVVVVTNGHRSNPRPVHVAVPVTDNLHPVANPAVDAEGNFYTTFSGSRGQKVPVAIYRIDDTYIAKPFVIEMMNPTGMA